MATIRQGQNEALQRNICTWVQKHRVGKRSHDTHK